MIAADAEKFLPGLIRQALGSKAGIGRTTVLKKMDDTLVAVLDLLSPACQVVVKLAGPTAPNLSSFDRTAAILMQVAAGTSIRMPEVLAVDVSYRQWPWRYLITTFLKGEEWATAREKMSLPEQENAYAQIGDAVGQLHSIHYPSFGELGPDGQAHPDQTFLEALANRAKLILKGTRSQSLFLSVLGRDRHLFTDVRQASLCHEDLHKYNLLFEQGQEGWTLKTILDFDKAWAGHAESDLARLSFWKGMTSPEFWSAYQVRQTIADGFRERRVIYQLLWCLEFASLSAQHLADTRGVCESLGISFPVDF